MYIQSNYFVLSFDVNSRQTPACALPISLTFRFGTHPHLGSPHFSAYSQLSRLFPLHTRHSAVSSLLPTHTKKGGGTPCHGLDQSSQFGSADRRSQTTCQPSLCYSICLSRNAPGRAGAAPRDVLQIYLGKAVQP